MEDKIKNKKLSIKHIIFYVLLGAFLGCSVYLSKVIPKISHQKWIERGSAYDVESEFVYSSFIRYARERGYVFGIIDENSSLDKYLYNLQKEQVDKAFEKIPETDGERVLWLKSLDIARWHKMEKRQDIPQIMPLQLKDFEALTSMPMKSKWAREIDRFEQADRLAAFFFSDYQNSGMSEEEIDKWKWKIVRKMNELSPLLDKDEFLKKHEYSRITPLQWEDTLFGGTTHLLLPTGTHVMRCNKEAVSIFLDSKSKIIKFLDFHKPIISSSFGTSWIKNIENDVNGNAEELVRKHCKDYL